MLQGVLQLVPIDGENRKIADETLLTKQQQQSQKQKQNTCSSKSCSDATAGHAGFGVFLTGTNYHVHRLNISA